MPEDPKKYLEGGGCRGTLEEQVYEDQPRGAQQMNDVYVNEWPAFRCRSCGADFDEPVKSDDNDDKPRCPDCGSHDLVDHRP